MNTMKLLIERMRSNKAELTMSANARLFDHNPMKTNLDRLGTSVEADIVSL
ncbi:hypothetical protein VDG1235_3963 [Verrucomicrobiia bacterium DG1235]|nr:hypothetical protein VDG1235_3963 [Verrucomicrobiae bacterium DG1235]